MSNPLPLQKFFSPAVPNAARQGRYLRHEPLANANRNAIVFGFKESMPVDNLMELKQQSLELSRRTGINFTRWLRQLHWQNL